MPRDFHQLKAWQKAGDLVLEVYRMTARDFPGEEKYGLTAQFRRAAVSAAANLAQGCGRRTEEEFRQFLYVALVTGRD
jgi:four helix bundle protein